VHQYKLIIFDWDGTLMDSVARIVSSMRSAAVDLALDIPSSEQVKSIIGMSLPQAIKQIFPLITPEQVQQVKQRYKMHYVELDNTPTPLFEHAYTLLEQLNQTDKLLAVATGKGREGLERVFAATSTKHFFHSSKCADESLSKPDPHMVNLILAELNVAAEHAVVIGDTVHDMAMAKNAGVDRIGVTFGVDEREKLMAYQPRAVVDSLAELSLLLIENS